MTKKEIVDIRSFKIPLALLILRIINEYGYMYIDELLDTLYNKEEEFKIISELLEIDTTVDFDNLGIREELVVLAQLKIINRESGSVEINDLGKQYIEIYDEEPKQIINKFYADLRGTNTLFRILCEKLEESHDGYVEKIVLLGSHPKANKPRVNFFKDLVTKQFKIAKEEKKGMKLLRKIESPPVDVIGKKIISIYRRDIGTALFLTIDYLWREIKKEFIVIKENDFDKTITYLMTEYPGMINCLSGIAKEGDKIFVDKITKNIYQYLEIYSDIFEENY